MEHQEAAEKAPSRDVVMLVAQSLSEQGIQATPEESQALAGLVQGVLDKGSEALAKEREREKEREEAKEKLSSRRG